MAVAEKRLLVLGAMSARQWRSNYAKRYPMLDAAYVPQLMAVLGRFQFFALGSLSPLAVSRRLSRLLSRQMELSCRVATGS